MTVQELLAMVQSRRESSAPDMNWLLKELNRFEDMVQKELFELYEGCPKPVHYTGTEFLRIPSPWDEAYLYILLSKIDLADGETEDYNTDMQMAETIMERYRNYYARTHMPKRANMDPWGRRTRKCITPF